MSDATSSTSCARRGHEPVVLTRSTGVDLVAGAVPALAEALTGVDVVIDVASKNTMSAMASREFFGAVTRNLLAAEASAGVRPPRRALDRRRRRCAVRLLRGQGAAGAARRGGGDAVDDPARDAVPRVRVADLPDARRCGPLVVVPTMQSQPVAAREVAERLVELAEGAPAGRVPDLAGPRVERMADMVRRWATATGQRGASSRCRFPARTVGRCATARCSRGPGRDLGVQTFDEWVAQVRPV